MNDDAAQKLEATVAALVEWVKARPQTDPKAMPFAEPAFLPSSLGMGEQQEPPPVPDPSQIWSGGEPPARKFRSEYLPGGEVPIGGIIQWGGLIASIPANWQLCDGTNGTPNLASRFIVGDRGVAPYDAIGNFGGFITHGTTMNDHTAHDLSGATITVGVHTPATIAAALANHSKATVVAALGDHAANDIKTSVGVNPTETRKLENGVTDTDVTYASAGTHDGTAALAHGEAVSGSGLAHAGTGSDITHTASASGSLGHSDSDNRPPYYVLAFIQRMS